MSNDALNSAWCPQAPNWQTVTALEVVSSPKLLANNTVVFPLGDRDLLVQLTKMGMRLKSSGNRELSYGLIVNEPKAEILTLISEGDKTLVKSDLFELKVEHSPFSFEFRHHDDSIIASSPTDGHFVRRFRVPPIARLGNAWLLSFNLDSDEQIYGLGEKWSSLNKRGQLIRSYNHDALGVNAEISYKNTPFCWSPEGWGVFTHTGAPVIDAVGYAPWSQRAYCLLIEDNDLDVFVLSEPKESKVGAAMSLIQAYTSITGRAPVPPAWSGGAILSKAYYQNENETLSVAKRVREEGLPCDIITIDGRAWQDTKTRFSFDWDKQRVPNPKTMMDKLKALNFKVCVWEYPLISIENDWFEMFAQKGWLLKDKRTGAAYEYDWDQQAFDDVLTPLPKSGIVDFTHPDAYQFWRDAHKPLFELGVEMIKADFGEQVEDENMVAYNGENGIALHNVYSYLYNRCVYEAAEKFCPSGAFLFSRSAWTGSQRFNSQWGGDPQADWEGMMSNIRGGLSWGLSGAPFYATDVGGFYKDTRDDALYVRWTQAGIFSAHFRLHGIGNREPWSYSEEASKAATAAINLRYRLQSYLLDCFQQASDTGIPVQRPMVLSFPEEKQSWSFENQFMFGDHILVAPCFKASGDVEVYLPKGEWFQINTDLSNPSKIFEGGRVLSLSLELDEIAAFVPKGVVLPINPLYQTTSEIPLNEQGEPIISGYWPQS